METISRRTFVKGVGAVSAITALSDSSGRSSGLFGGSPAKLSEAGWCWDGQGFNGGVNPSIFGAGEGTRWFGLNKVCHMFHPNDELAMDKLRDFEAVVCEISKWKVRRCDNGVAHYLDGDIGTKQCEASTVSRLSRSFPNIKGAIDDDLMGIIKRKKLNPKDYGSVHEALKQENPDLKLWTVVYTHELKNEDWQGFKAFADVINLWEWDAKRLPDLPGYVERCQEIFPDKPIVVGCYLRDFPSRAAVPMEMLKVQWNHVLDLVSKGTIAGYSILGGFLIDMHQKQAEWIRDFIAAN